jgi:Flp pilus assembly pilin Flp
MMINTAILGSWASYARDERGATAVEYCIIAGTIGLALLPASNGLQAAIIGKFTEMNGWFK